MDIVVISDVLTLPRERPEGNADLLLSCGDVPDNVILEAADIYGCDTIFAVKGNHDSSAPFRDPIRDAHLQSHTFRGLDIAGFNGCWRYKPAGNYLYEQEQVAGLMRGFPPVDIFIAHNSPEGIHECDQDVHRGFRAFRTYIREEKPALFFHGHQHVREETRLGGMRVIGVYGVQMFEDVI